MTTVKKIRILEEINNDSSSWLIFKLLKYKFDRENNIIVENCNIQQEYQWEY